MKLHHLAGLLLLPALLAGCGASHDSTIVDGNISLHDGVAVVRVAGQPNARISGDGNFSIDDKPVTLTADQRDLFKQYYVDVYKIRSQGIATGKAGADMASHAVGSVMSGLAHGDADKIGPAIEAQAGKITAQASLICDDLDRLRADQDAIVGQVPAFRPYATLNADKIAQCKKGLDEANRSLATH